MKWLIAGIYLFSLLCIHLRGKVHLPLRYCHRRTAQMKFHSMLFVSLANEVPKLRTEDLFQGHYLSSHNLNFDTPVAERCCDFKSDETRANHDSVFCVLCILDNLAAILKGS